MVVEVAALSLSYRELTSTRATAHRSTCLTPAASSAHFTSASVLPVVMTSSTTATCPASNNLRRARAPLRRANAPRTLRCRSSMLIEVCDGVSRTRFMARGAHGTPSIRPA